ncbi:ROK family protein [bacterium]|nr:ROK family protein [FCB group bacterium]MBL7190543.1 ROK family protein [bacterium]
MNKIFAGFDLGGTYLKYCLGTGEGGILYKNRLDSKASGSIEDIIEAFKTAYNDLKVQADRMKCEISSAGIGTPGAIDQEKGIVFGSTPNILTMKNYPLRARLSEEFQLRTAMDNDGNLAALAEAAAGAGKGHNSVLALTIGTGIGGGFVSNGKIFRGGHGSALEIGHTSIDYDGRLCGCGRRGCIEAYASGSALLKAANHGRISFDTPQEVFSSAKEGVNSAVKAVNDALNALSSGIANLLIAFDPGCVVIGGGVMPGYLDYWEELEQQVCDKVIDSLKGKAPILPAETGNDAGIIGAILLASESY